jgi:hypothetical protein
MLFTRIALGALTLLVLIMIPVSAAPALQTGSRASYSLSVSISFQQSCGPVGDSTLSPGIICPMIAMLSPAIETNGTISWAVTKLDSTTANLNVTRDLTTSNTSIDAQAAHHIGSFNETIDLATRIANILLFIMPEVDQALLIAQPALSTSLPAGTAWSSSIPTIDSMMHRSVYTMWWVNGPLKLNQTVPVLVFPTNVTGTTSVDLGAGLGTRTGWNLTFTIPRPILPPSPLASTASALPIANNLEIALSFIYDQKSDLLLAASADIEIGFGIETTIPQSPCNTSSSTACPAPSGTMTIFRQFGISIQAQMKLTSTTIDLSQPQTLTSSSQNGNSPQQSGTGSNPGSGSTPDSPSRSGSTSTAAGTGQPASNTKLPSTNPPSWVYGVLGVIAAAIVGAGLWIARRRIKNTNAKIPMTPASP